MTHPDPTMPAVDRSAVALCRGNLKVPDTGRLTDPSHSGPSARDNRLRWLAGIGIVAASLALPAVRLAAVEEAGARVSFGEVGPRLLTDGFVGLAGPLEGGEGRTLEPPSWGPDRPAGVLEGGVLRTNGTVQRWWLAKAERTAAADGSNGVVSNSRVKGQ